MFVKVVNEILISKLSFRQTGGAHASRARKRGRMPHFYKSPQCCFLNGIYRITNSKDGILRESRAIYSIAAARSKNIRICLSNPIYDFDEGRELSEPA
jgi:hypothetical protein